MADSDKERKQLSVIGVVGLIGYKTEELLKDWLHLNYLGAPNIFEDLLKEKKKEGMNDWRNARFQTFRKVQENDANIPDDEHSKTLLTHFRNAAQDLIDECQQFPKSEAHGRFVEVFKIIHNSTDLRDCTKHLHDETQATENLRRRVLVLVLRRIVECDFNIKFTFNEFVDRVFKIKRDQKESKFLKFNKALYPSSPLCDSDSIKLTKISRVSWMKGSIVFHHKAVY